MGRDRAAYMREYRKRGKIIDMTTTPGRIAASFDIVKADLRIAELEEEVRHLKAELATRAFVVVDAGDPIRDAPGFNTRPFTPVPKKR